MHGPPGTMQRSLRFGGRVYRDKLSTFLVSVFPLLSCSSQLQRPVESQAVSSTAPLGHSFRLLSPAQRSKLTHYTRRLLVHSGLPVCCALRHFPKSQDPFLVSK